MIMVEPHCYYCVYAEGKCPDCVERSAFVATEEAREPRQRFLKVPITEDEA